MVNLRRLVSITLMTILALGLIASALPATAQEIRLGFAPRRRRAPIRARPSSWRLSRSTRPAG